MGQKDFQQILGRLDQHDALFAKHESRISKLESPAIITPPIPKTTWVVRPQGGGPYGTGDGKTYANAFEGLENISFGEGSGQIPPVGHEIYVAGAHLLHQTNKASNLGVINAPEGTPENRNVWRGDDGGEPGIIYGGHKIAYEPFIVDQSGVYKFTSKFNYARDNFLEILGGTAVNAEQLFAVATLEECYSTAGTIFGSPGFGVNHTIYVHLSDGSDPTGKLIGSAQGYDLVFDGPGGALAGTGHGLRYSDFCGLDFRILRKLSAARVSPSNLRFENCGFSYGTGDLFGIHGTSSINDLPPSENLEWVDCFFRWAGNGIYFYGNRSTVTNWKIVSCVFEDMARRLGDANTDGHGVGVQGSQNGLLKLGTFKRCTRPVVFWLGANQEYMRNIIIEQNKVSEYNGQPAGGVLPVGISISGGVDNFGDKSGIVIQRNVIDDYPIGIKTQSEYPTLVEDNITNRCNTGYFSSRNSGGIGTDVKLRRNKFLETKDRQIDWRTRCTSCKLDSDFNTFTGVDNWRHGPTDQDFAAWKRNTTPAGSTFDSHSTYSS